MSVATTSILLERGFGAGITTSCIRREMRNFFFDPERGDLKGDDGLSAMRQRASDSGGLRAWHKGRISGRTFSSDPESGNLSKTMA